MNLTQAIELIQRRTGYRNNKADEIYDELVLAQERLEQGVVVQQSQTTFTFLPWFLVQEINTETTVVDEERVAVPPGFLKEFEPDALWYYNASADTSAGESVWNVLQKGDLDFLRGLHPGSGPPAAYALTGRYFRILPVPDAAYTLKMMFYQAEDVLTENAPNTGHLWLTHAGLLLCAEATKEFVVSTRDAGAKTWAEQTYAREALRLFVATEDRAHSNVQYVMGGED